MITDRISLLEKAISSNISYQNLESLLTLIGQEQKEIKFPIWIKKSSESRKKELYDIFSKKKRVIWHRNYLRSMWHPWNT